MDFSVGCNDFPTVRHGLRAWPSVRIRGIHSLRPRSTPGGTYYDTWPWTTWIKPDIDRAIALGGNTVGFNMHIDAAQPAGVTKANFLARMTQALDYIAAQGMYAFILIRGIDTQINATFDDWTASLAALLHTYSNVIAIDGLNEIDLIAGRAWANMSAFVTHYQPLIRANCDIPLTFSLSTNVGDATIDPAYVPQLARRCDFMAYHPYYSSGTNMPVSDLTAFRAAAWHKPFMLSEVGVNDTWETATGDSTFRGSRWTAAGTVIRSGSDGIGSMMFVTSDFQADPPNKDGAYRVDGSGGPDADAVAAIASWPTTY